MRSRMACCLLFILNLGCHAETLPPGSNGRSLPQAAISLSETLGYPVGSRAATYDEVNRCVSLLDRTSDRIKRTTYGRSHEGRSLYYLTITDPANHQRLAQLQADNARLSDPRKGSDGLDLDKRFEKQPAVAWLNYSIHGDELSSTDAALIVAHHLATAKDPNTLQLLRDTIIHLVPLVNPDGRERFLGQIRQFTGSSSPPDVQAMHHAALWTRGRGNHYLFDLNRDWLILEQPEVRHLAAVLKDWHPQLLVDSHEMGPDDTYLFDPPNQPHNLHLADSILRWRTTFGADQARAFDRHGWSYYTGDWYTDWAPIYTNAWASLRDAIGLLYEQARANSSAVRQPNGQVLTYRDSVQHHVVSTLANLQTLQQNRQAILKNFATLRQNAVSTKNSNVFLLPPHRDRDRWIRFVDILQRQGIEVGFTQTECSAQQVTGIGKAEVATHRFPAGTAVVKIAQPLRNLLRTLLEFDPRLTDEFLLKERRELEKHRRTRMYDTSTWNLPMAFGLPAYWAQSLDTVALQDAPPQPDPSAALAVSQYGYLIDGQRWDVCRALVRLYQQNHRVRMATKPFRVGDRDYDLGTLLLRNHENPDSLHTDLQSLQTSLGIKVIPMDSALVQSGHDLGGRRFQLLTPPRTAICSRWPVSTTSFGSLWYLLDQRAGLACSPVSVQTLGHLDLRSYNVLVLPESGDLNPLLNASTLEKLQQWVQSGGTLIAVGSSAAFLAQETSKLSAVRLKRDVLEELEVYREAVHQERNAHTIKVDARQVWEPLPPPEPNTAAGKPDDKPDQKARLRQDEWARIFRPSGVFLAGQVDTEHWLAAGLDGQLPAYFRGDKVLMSRHPVQTILRLAPAADVRLSGLLWPEARTRIADSAYVTVERHGRGQVILFAADPSYRLWFAGLQRLLLNAVLLGPGLGTDPPRPW